MYRKQINDLDYPHELIRLYLSEGDSQDDTRGILCAWALEDERIRISHHDTGIAREFHTTRPERMRAMALPGNRCWDLIAEEAWGDFALMLEADLVYQTDLLTRLVERLPREADLFAPFIWILVDGALRFYDIWAFRFNGKMFRPFPPAWYANEFGDTPFELDSVGSVVLFRMKVITDGVRLTEDRAVVGMCELARSKGYRVFADPDTHVMHPSISGVS